MSECTSSATRRRSSLPDEAASVFADHAAGAPLRPAVAAAMVAALNGGPPNPSGAHRAARSTAMVLDAARRRIADELGADAADVVLTGGGTESCALGLLGPRNPSAVCISAIEHVAVRRAAEVAAARRGVELIVLPVDSQGRFDLEAALALVPDGALVSVMAANNETGVIEPIAELSRALRADRSILLHCDAIAAAPFSSIAELWPYVDLLSIAGHKVGGPPGVGVLVASRDLDLEAIVPGGSQESGRRAGTQDVAGATGLAVALEEVARERQLGQIAELAHRRDVLAKALSSSPGVAITSDGADRLAGHLHLTLPGVRSEEVLVLLDRAGIAASAGAACASGAPETSQVLLAMGMDERRARSALRLTMGVSTTSAAWDRLAEVVPEVLSSLAR